MDTGALLDLWRGGLHTTAAVAGPCLLAALGVGLLTSLIQAATQLQENVLSFVPKLIAVALVLLLGGHVLFDRLTHYAVASLQATVTVAREGRQ